jgi:hypothetical protein
VSTARSESASPPPGRTAPAPASDAAAPDPARAASAHAALANGPPVDRLYRCAALARLLGETRGGDSAAGFATLAEEFDAAIGRLAGLLFDNADPVRAGAQPNPLDVLQSVRAEGAQAGPRFAAWLDDSWARCGDEVAWLDEVRVLVAADAGALAEAH